MDYIIRGLAKYPPPVNFLSKQKRSMRHGMKKTGNLTVRLYVAHLIDLNEYFAALLGATLIDKIGVTELDEIFLNSMPNSLHNQAYAQGYNCESITYKNY